MFGLSFERFFVIGLVAFTYMMTNHGSDFSFHRWRIYGLLIFPILLLWRLLRSVRWTGSVIRMRDSPDQRAWTGRAVTLTQVPPGLLENLPTEDQQAITEVVGRPIRLVKYDRDGRAELEFTDSDGVLHLVYVDPSYITPAE